MSPKEKAKELVDKFQNIIIDNYSSQFKNAKQCALIAVNEVLGYMGADRGTEFWLEVRSEIKKL